MVHVIIVEGKDGDGLREQSMFVHKRTSKFPKSIVYFAQSSFI